MSAFAYAVSDSATMLRRDLLHSVRYKAMTVSSLVTPIIMLLLFGYVLGGALGAGFGGRSAYIDFVVPGIILMTVGFNCSTAAVIVCTDVTEGIISRFRTMAIGRGSVLSGYVLGNVFRTLICIGLLLGVAVLMGFRPTAGLGEWIAAVGVMAMLTFALTWLSVAFGLLAKSPGEANGYTLFFQLLAFFGNAFVPPDSMPAGLRWFAEYQPFSPIIATLRGLLLGTPIGNDAIFAVAWCAGITLVGYLSARGLFNRDPAH